MEPSSGSEDASNHDALAVFCCGDLHCSTVNSQHLQTGCRTQYRPTCNNACQS